MAYITPPDILHHQATPVQLPGQIRIPDQTPTRYFYIKTTNPNIVKVHGIRRMPNPTPSGIETVWAFPDYYPRALTSLKDLKAVHPGVQASKPALAHITYLKQIPEYLANLTTLNSLDYQFKLPPYPHQATALEYMLHYRRLALILDMGLGKTPVSLIYAEIMKHRLVVLAPRVALGHWIRETYKFTGLKPVLYYGTPEQREHIRHNLTEGSDTDWNVLVTNYESVTPNYRTQKKDKKTGKKSKTKQAVNQKDLEFFKDLEFDCFILDEASRIKGHASDRGRAVDDLASRADYRFLLSGTLSQGDPLDVFQPLKILDSSIIGGNYHKVRAKYCEFSPYNKHVITGFKNLDDLKNRMDPYVLSMTKDDNLSLPERMISEKVYTLTDEQRELYNSIVDNERIALPTKNQPNGEIRCPITVIKITKLLQILSGFVQLSPERDYTKCNECEWLLQCMCIKPDPDTEEFNLFEKFPWDPDCKKHDPENPVRKPTPEVYWLKENPKLELLEDTMETLGVFGQKPEKLIIWCQFKQDLKIIQEFLKKKRVEFVTPLQKNSDKTFQEDASVGVYLGQVSQGIATTLTEAAYTYYYSHSLVLEHRDQSMDRNYRIGQERPTFVMDAFAEGTIEETVLALLAKKQDVKTFIQQNLVCEKCEHGVTCFEQRIRPYTEDCVLYDQRKKAEEKQRIKVSALEG